MKLEKGTLLYEFHSIALYLDARLSLSSVNFALLPWKGKKAGNILSITADTDEEWRKELSH